MYESPIKMFAEQMRTEMENDLLHTIQKIAYAIDKDELIKALKYDRDQYRKGYNDGLNANKWNNCSERLPETSEPVLVAYHEPPFMGIKDDKLYYKVVNFVPQANAWNIKSPIEIVKWLPIPEAE